MDRLSHNTETSTTAWLADCALDAGTAAIKEAFQKPYAGLRQMVAHANVTLPEWQLPQEHDAAGLPAAAGRVVGAVFDYCLLSSAVGRLTTIGRLRPASTWLMEATKMGTTGGIIAALQPVKDDREFRTRKCFSVLEGIASGAVFGATNGALNRIGFLGRAGDRSFLADATISGVAGFTGGAVGDGINLLAPNNDGNRRRALGTSALSGGLVGFGMSALERLALGRVKIALPMSDEPLSTPTMTTEDWVANHYNPALALRSPILTLIAHQNPSLRPPNYEVLRALAWAPRARHLSLGDWLPEQRPALVQELRRLSGTDFSSDANLDAFISRFHTSTNVSLAAAFAREIQPIDELEMNMRRELLRDKTLSDITFVDATERMNQTTLAAKSPLLAGCRLQMMQLRGQRLRGPTYKQINEQFGAEYNRLAGEIGLPRVDLEITDGVGGGYSPGSASVGLSGGLTAHNIEGLAHEFNHHRQGITGVEPYLYGARKLVISPIAKALGMTKGLPRMQQTANTTEYLLNYVNTRMERESFALGLLANMRALQAGLPPGRAPWITPVYDVT